MEPIVFENSDKNIPVHDYTIVKKLFLHALTVFDRTLRFASHFFLNPDEVPEHKNWYEFKSNKPAPHVPELKDFRNDLLKMSENVHYISYHNSSEIPTSMAPRPLFPWMPCLIPRI